MKFEIGVTDLDFDSMSKAGFNLELPCLKMMKSLAEWETNDV